MATMHAGSGDHHFILDLRTADTSNNAIERYKAFTRLLSALKRRIDTARIHLTPLGLAPNLVDALEKTVMVGECLARAGTVEFPERSNSSRAIHTKDYCSLLTQFFKMYDEIFTTAFTARLPQELQDHVHAVGNLLSNRREASDLLFTQLLKQAGSEGQGNGQAVVNNTSYYTGAGRTGEAGSNWLKDMTRRSVWVGALFLGSLQAGGLLISRLRAVAAAGKSK